jgi:hypothetical protein
MISGSIRDGPHGGREIYVARFVTRRRRVGEIAADEAQAFLKNVQRVFVWAKKRIDSACHVPAPSLRQIDASSVRRRNALHRPCHYFYVLVLIKKNVSISACAKILAVQSRPVF